MGLRHHERAVLLHEQHVCAACFLNVGARLGVEIEVLGITAAMRLHRRAQRHSVVQARLDIARAMRCGAVVLGDAQLDRLQAAFEVRADRRDQDAEGVLGSGGNADDLARTDHERTHVERSTRTERRHPSSVRAHNGLHGLDELVLREAGHLETLGRIEHALSVHVGAEADDRAVLGGVGLQTLEDLLAIVENARALGKVQVVIGGQAAFIPFTIFPMRFKAVVGLMVAEIEAAPVQVFFLDGHRLLLINTGANSYTHLARYNEL